MLYKSEALFSCCKLNARLEDKKKMKCKQKLTTETDIDSFEFNAEAELDETFRAQDVNGMNYSVFVLFFIWLTCGSGTAFGNSNAE